MLYKDIYREAAKEVNDSKILFTMNGLWIHKMAVIDDDVELSKGVRIWSGAVVRRGSQIAENVVIGSNAYIGEGSSIGANTHIQHGVFLPNRSFIGPNVFIGPNATFTDDKFPRAHNAAYTAEPPFVCEWASVGAGAVILPGVTLGAACMVGAGSVVTTSVSDGATVVGNPARRR